MGQTLGQRTFEFDKALNDAAATGLGWLKILPNGDMIRIDPRDISQAEDDTNIPT